MNSPAENPEPLPRKRPMPGSPEVIYTGVPTIEYDGGREEKPWQRVYYEVTRKGPHLYEPVKSVACPLIIVVLGVYLLLGYLTQLVEDEMPRVIPEVDIARDNTETFSEEAAWRYLRVIIGDEPRVSGTRYHLQKTQDLKLLVDSVAAFANQPVQTDWQMTDGGYWLTFTIPHVNIYQNVSNVIALLEGESGFHPNGTIGTSLLLNCHYDSVPYAIGVSDNAIFCAVMVEILSRLSRRTQKLKHNVVFLFNGAEENTLQGSHGFLQHPWARGITNVINLDAAGMNGKPHVFQVTDTRLLSAYRRVSRRAAGQSIGEFLFSSGIIPSDTDFRIWRDFGNFHGLDIAFIKWGHVYHTRYDHPDLVRPGVIQNAGDMLLALTTTVADDQRLSVQVEPSAAVYFDYLYWFMVSYSYGAAIAVDLIIALFALLSVAYYVWLVGPRWTSVRELLISLAGRVTSMLAGLLVCAIFTPIMVASTRQLRYLTEPWIVVPLFWVPYLMGAVCAAQAYDAWRAKRTGMNRSIRAAQAMAATRLLVAIVLVVITCIPSLTTVRYMISWPLMIMSIMSIVSLTFVRYFRMPAWLHLIMEVAFSLPSAMFMLSLALRFNAMLLPIMGRGHSYSPDYTVAMLNIGLAMICAMTVSGIELLFSRKRLWLAVTPLALVCITLMFIPFSPYRDEGPSTQRHYWFHSEMVTYDYNGQVTERVSGVQITQHDAYTISSMRDALRAAGLSFPSRDNFTSECERFVYCNLPVYRMRFGEYLQDSLFLYMGGPAPFTPESSIQLLNRTCIGESCTFRFLMTGPAHNTLTLWPRENVNISSWSLQSPVLPSFNKDGRPVYVIVHSAATFSDPLPLLEFTVNFIVPLSQQSQPIVSLDHHAFRIHHPEEYTTEYRNLLNAMPKYFNVASFLTFRRNYVF